jgi:hypothetical protein
VHARRACATAVARYGLYLISDAPLVLARSLGARRDGAVPALAELITSFEGVAFVRSGLMREHVTATCQETQRFGTNMHARVRFLSTSNGVPPPPARTPSESTPPADSLPRVRAATALGAGTEGRRH